MKQQLPGNRGLSPVAKFLRGITMAIERFGMVSLCQQGNAMPRRARLILPNVPLHVIQRGNNKQQCFFSESDYRVYLEWLADYASANGCQVHAYVLMSNHVHLLLSIAEHASLAMLMKGLGQKYSQYINRRYQRSGTLWEGRYRSCLVQDETYLLVCQRYIELNPVRAGMVEDPAEYAWSSYRSNAQGQVNRILRPHAAYLAMGIDADKRQQAYRALFRAALEPQLLNAVRKATNGNFIFGSQSYMQRIKLALGIRVEPEHAGRPKR